MEPFMYEFEPDFWWKVILFLVIPAVLLVSFNVAMRKLLKLEKQKLSSNNYVNDQHKKVNWIIRGAFIVVLLIGFFINVTREPMERYWFLETWNLIFALIFVTGALQAIMEWKYAEHRNAYILTVSQLVFIAVLLILLFSTNFFGWFG